MKATGPLGHVKRKAKNIKKRHPYIPLMTVQHDLACHLGFKKWDELILASPIELQKRIDRHSLVGL